MTHIFAKLLAPVVKDYSELTLRQLNVLALLPSAKPKDRTVRALAELMGVNKPAITRAADRLQLEKLAVRVPDPNDGRSIYINITPAGERALAKCLKAAGLSVAQPPAVTKPAAPSRKRSGVDTVSGVDLMTGVTAQTGAIA